MKKIKQEGKGEKVMGHSRIKTERDLQHKLFKLYSHTPPSPSLPKLYQGPKPLVRLTIELGQKATSKSRFSHIIDLNLASLRNNSKKTCILFGGVHY